MGDTGGVHMKLLRRNLSLMLAVRYLNPLRSLFSVITLICLAGVSLGVMVLIVVLSVMSGLQQEMQSRMLAFTPHYVVALSDGLQRLTLTDERGDWQTAQANIEKLPGVAAVYPQLENDAFAQSDAGRSTVHFCALQPHNDGQAAALKSMIKAGTCDFGEGLDQECVLSAPMAQGLGLGVGDSLHLTPVGSLDEVADIYAMIQNPLQTQENKTFMQAAETLFEGAAAAEGGVQPAAEKLETVVNEIMKFRANRLRDSEKEACATLFRMAEEHRHVPFTAEEQQCWQDTVAGLAALDRDKEDGKAVKSINEMVMPVDLKVVGIYQAPENMPCPQVYMPLQIAQDVMGYSNDNQVMGLCIRMKDPDAIASDPRAVEDFRDAVSLALPHVSAEADTHSDFGWCFIPWTKSYEQYFELIANERVMMSFVLSIISLIASFCIMSVMFTMSMQRKREIAVLQAMGATPAKIMGIFAWQGIIIGVVGALLGVVLALLTLYYRLEIQSVLAYIGLDPFPMVAHGITLPAAYDPATFAWQAFKAFVMVTGASLLPAFCIARQDPARALRSN